MGKWGSGKLEDDTYFADAETKHLMSQVKSPVELRKMEKQIIANQKMTKDEIEYKQYLRKMANLAESKRNMKIDFRPKVVRKVMRTELLIFGFGLCMTFGMPIYFLKVVPYLEKYNEENALKLEMDLI